MTELSPTAQAFGLRVYNAVVDATGEVIGVYITI